MKTTVFAKIQAGVAALSGGLAFVFGFWVPRGDMTTLDAPLWGRVLAGATALLGLLWLFSLYKGGFSFWRLGTTEVRKQWKALVRPLLFCLCPLALLAVGLWALWMPPEAISRFYLLACACLTVLCLLALCALLGPRWAGWQAGRRRRVLALCLGPAGLYLYWMRNSWPRLPLPLAVVLVGAAAAFAVSCITILVRLGALGTPGARKQALAALLLGLAVVGAAYGDIAVPQERVIPLTITPLGEKSEASGGVGVTVQEFNVSEIVPIDLAQLAAVTPGWEMTDAGLYSEEAGQSVMYEFKPGQYTYIGFVKGPNAGRVEVAYDNVVKEVDLYSPFVQARYLRYEMPPVGDEPFYKPFAAVGLLLFVWMALQALYVPLLARVLAWGRAKVAPPAKHRLQYVLLGAAVPFIYLFYLSYQNPGMLDFGQVLVLAAGLSLVSAAAQLLLARAFGSPAASSLVLVVFWMLFFTFRLPYTLLNGLWPGFGLGMWLACFLVLAAGLLAAALSLGRRLRVEGLRVAEVLMAFLLLVNLVPVTWREVSSRSASAELYKTSYNIDNSLPSPNVYWLHMDGMLSFDVLEEYYDDPQEELTGQLAERGFEINRDGWFEAAHSTKVAVAMLMSPDYYDKVLAEEFTTGEMLDKNSPKVAERIRQLTFVRSQNELVRAFEHKGYEASIIANNFNTFPSDTARFYDYGEYAWHTYTEAQNGEPPLILNQGTAGGEEDVEQELSLHMLGNLSEVLCASSLLCYAEEPLNEALAKYRRAVTPTAQRQRVDIDVPEDRARDILGDEYYEWGVTMIRSLQDTLNAPEPRLVLMHNMMPHFNFRFDAEGRYLPGSASQTESISLYHGQHQYSARVMLDMVDLILEADPGAVIVLQADHGIHHIHYVDEMRSLGYSDADVQNMWNGVFSAVRIPDDAGGLGSAKSSGLDEPLGSLNITRELVNRYVGPNYQLLPEEKAG